MSCAGQSIQQNDFDTEVEAVCQAKGPKGSFEADILLDSGSQFELKLLTHKADQLGLPYEVRQGFSVSSHDTKRRIHQR